MSTIVGIDLGTTNSLVAVRQGNETKVIVNAEGSRLTPSAVAFTDEGRLIGRSAKSQAATNPARTITSIKRFMGRRHSEVAAEEKLVSYKLVGTPEELVKVDVDGKTYYPPEISAMILQDLKKSAETYLGQPVSRAVITVPAWFNDSQRQATREAGQIAGLEVVRIVNEPTAAALAYGLQGTGQQKVFCCDLGGGTFDCTALDISNGVFEVLSTSGDTQLGGDDWDQAIVNYLVADFLTTTGIDLSKDAFAMQRIREAAEKAKCDLSAMPQTGITVPYITSVGGTPRHLSMTLLRSKFEELTDHLFERIRKPIMQAIADSKLLPSQFDNVVLVGGSTRIPRVQDICKEIFGREPHKGVNVDEVVAVGAAIQAKILEGDDPTLKAIVLLDVTPLSLSVETLGGVATIMIPRNTTVPVTKTETYSTATDNQPAVDIHVLQGERKMASDNRTLGRFTMTGIPPCPRGVPQIEVSFALDANGILNVSSKDKNTGREQKIEIRGASGLDKEQVNRMVSEAKQFEADDKARSDLAEAKNTCNQKVYQIEKVFKEFSGKLSKPTLDAMQGALAVCRVAADGNDKGSIDKAVYNLGLVNDKMSEELSQKKREEAAAAQQNQGPFTAPPQQQAPPQPKPPDTANQGPFSQPPPAPPPPGAKKPTEVSSDFQPMQ